MTRNATSSFSQYDPDVLDAARDVARRAGMPLEAWIAANVPSGPENRRRRRRQRAGEGREDVGLPQRGEADGQPYRAPAPAHLLGAERPPETYDALLRRLDGIDRALAGGHSAEASAAGRLMQSLEARIDRALGADSIPVAQISARLGEIERRMSDLGDQVAARPPGRRGRPPAQEIRSAVQEIRQRQRDLGEGWAEAPQAVGQAGAVAAMHEALARRLSDANPLSPQVSAQQISEVVAEVRRETARLRESLSSLATGRDVGALEQAVVSLATGIEQVQASADLSAIAAPVELIRAQVERLADEVADTVHTRVTGDVERLAARLDGVAARAPSDAGERDALSAVFRELDEIRRLVAALAGPERIQSLAQGLQAISAQIAQLQTAGGDEAGLRPLLEEIRSGLVAPAPAALVRQIDAIAVKVDALHARADRPREAAEIDSRAILGRIDALSDKVDRVGTHPVGELLGRLEGLDARLSGSAPAGADIAGIDAMLRSLAEKVDRFGGREGGGNLDALERQVVGLAERMEARGRDPALAGLERTMGDLLAQVTGLRDAGRGEGAPAEIGALRAGLADLQARQAAADQRLSTTLDGFQSVLERLATRVEAPASQAPAPARPQAAAPRPQGARPEAPRPGTGAALGEELLEPGAARPRGEARNETRAEARTETGGDGQPAAGRGHPLRARLGQERAAEAASAEPAGDLKTSFIAAARRAAQAAQAELDQESALAVDRREPRARKAGPAASRAEGRAGAGRIAALRAELDRRRRPLLLGLAAIVLALGALQFAGLGPFGEDAPPAPAPRIAAPAGPVAAPVAAPAATAEAPREAARDTARDSARDTARDSSRDAVKEPGREASAPAAKPAPSDPQTTQAIGGAAQAQAPAQSATQGAIQPASPAPAEARPARARPGVPSVPGMAAMSGDLAALPPGVAKLKQEALGGDGAAVWELATRIAEGRDGPRDLALSTKLFERLAGTGYAPAQYKLAGHYEKGLGVTRDLGQAKLWYGRAAEQGHVRSMHNLAVLYAENPGASGKPDYASAASWFRQGAENGVRDSQYNLAVLYARGLGLTQDLVQSYAWFAAAAGQGDEDAGKKRDDVATKLSPADLAAAKAAAAAFKPRKLDPAVNEPPAAREGGSAAMTLLGAPTPSPTAFSTGRKGG